MSGFRKLLHIFSEISLVFYGHAILDWGRVTMEEYILFSLYVWRLYMITENLLKNLLGTAVPEDTSRRLFLKFSKGIVQGFYLLNFRINCKHVDGTIQNIPSVAAVSQCSVCKARDKKNWKHSRLHRDATTNVNLLIADMVCC